eukprot:gene12064-5558_t
MNCFGDLSTEEKLMFKSDSIVSKELEKLENQDKEVCKALLLGAGGCGKSTIFRQMKILHLKGFGEEEKKEYKKTIYENIRDVFYRPLKYCEENSLKISEENQQIANLILEAGLNHEIPKYNNEFAKNLIQLWKDDSMKKAVENKKEFFFVENLGRIIGDQEKYIPNDSDILRSRKRTTGIHEQRFQIQQAKMLMVDVGGQRNERRKWIHAFDSVNLIIFMTSLTEYNEYLEENRSVNRLVDSLDLFSDIINDKSFRKKSLIIFYNKDDLFRKMIKETSLNVCEDVFPDYDGEHDYDKAIVAISQEFRQKIRKTRKIAEHTTTATDTTLVAKVFEYCYTLILEQVMVDYL